MGVLKEINVYHMCADGSGGQYRTSDSLELVQVSGGPVVGVGVREVPDMGFGNQPDLLQKQQMPLTIKPSFQHSVLFY